MQMKKTAKGAYLPRELLVEILKRLPVKSLLRFRSVSKSWCSLISNPRFITLHKNYNFDSPRMFVNYYPSEHCALIEDNDALELQAELEFPFKMTLNRIYRILGSCNGLICVGYDLFPHDSVLFLWNPTVRKFVTLPPPGITSDSNRMFGFGFDSKSNDYKVVRIVNLQGRNGFKVEVELYELSTGAWRSISAVVPSFVMCSYPLQSNMNGVVHWFASNPTNTGGSSFVLAFDLIDEVFKKMRLPNTLANESPMSMSIAACCELLSLFHCYQNSSNRCCSVWVMKKYGMDNSWAKLFNIELSQGVSAVLGSRKNGELLLVTDDGKLVSYDPNDEQVKDLGITRRDTFRLYINTYIESLTLLDGDFGVLDCDSVPGLL